MVLAIAESPLIKRRVQRKQTSAHFRVFIVILFAWLFSPMVCQASGFEEAVWLTAGENASKEIWVSFSAKKKYPKARIHFGEAGQLSKSVKMARIEEIGGATGFVHHARLSNLTPATSYAYAIRNGQSAYVERSFRTPSLDPCKPTRFVVFGDNRSQTFGSAMGKLPQKMLETNPDFALNSGDMVKNGRKRDQWLDYLKEITPLASRVVVMHAIGNHDDGPGRANWQYVNRIFPTPANNPENNRSYYSFRFNSARIGVVTNHDGGVEKQAMWLSDTMREHETAWKFLMVHEPFFTCSLIATGHKADEMGVRRAYFEVMKNRHIDAVFSGHNHYYELFKPHDTKEFIDDAARGTIFITSGGGSMEEALMMLHQPSFFCEGRLQKAASVHFVRVDIENRQAKFYYHELGGRFTSRTKPAELHYVIEKPTGILCE